MLILPFVLAAAMTLSTAEHIKTAFEDLKGSFEMVMFIPWVAFDTTAPIPDNQGQSDEIANGFGYGLGVGYNFPQRHAIEISYYKVVTDSEDMQGANFFSIHTRYYTLGYRKNWNWKGNVDPFLTAGAGDFYAKAKEVNHSSYGGPAVYVGGGLRFSPARRSSLRIYAQEMYVELNNRADYALNFMVTLGGVFYFGLAPSEPTP
jgi:hypothetical protein